MHGQLQRGKYMMAVLDSCNFQEHPKIHLNFCSWTACRPVLKE